MYQPLAISMLTLEQRNNPNTGLFALVEFTEKFFSLEPGSLFNDTRAAELVFARSAMMYVMNMHCGWSKSRIGRTMSKDHSTVIYAISKMSDLLDIGNPDVEYRTLVKYLEATQKRNYYGLKH